MEGGYYFDGPSLKYETSQPSKLNLLSQITGFYKNKKLFDSIDLKNNSSNTSLEVLSSANSSSIMSFDDYKIMSNQRTQESYDISHQNSCDNYILGFKSLDLWNRTEILQRSANRELYTQSSNDWRHIQYPSVMAGSYQSAEEMRLVSYHYQSRFKVNDMSSSSGSDKVSIVPYNYSYCKRVNEKSSTSKKKIIPAIADKRQYCTFCHANNEDFALYSAHLLRNPKTRVLECPVLRKLVCPLCGATGDEAHTLTYCSLNKSSNGSKPTSVFCHIKRSRRLASGRLRN